MPFSFTGLALKIKDNPFGFEDANIIRNDDLYLKQQSEVLIVQDGTAMKTDVVPEASLVVANAPFAGAVLGYQGTSLKWEHNSLDDPLYWLFF